LAVIHFLQKASAYIFDGVVKSRDLKKTPFWA